MSKGFKLNGRPGSSRAAPRIQHGANRRLSRDHFDLIDDMRDCGPVAPIL